MLGIGNKNAGAEGSAINLIGVGTQIIGDIISSGDVRIDGTLSGNIKLNGRLVVGPNGTIEGNVNCQNADISGEVKGTVYVPARDPSYFVTIKDYASSIELVSRNGTALVSRILVVTE